MKNFLLPIFFLTWNFLFSQETKFRVELLNPDPNFVYTIEGGGFYTFPQDSSFEGPLAFDTIKNTSRCHVWESFLPYSPKYPMVLAWCSVNSSDPDEMIGNRFIQVIPGETVTKKIFVTLWDYGYPIYEPKKVIHEEPPRQNIAKDLETQFRKFAPKYLGGLREVQTLKETEWGASSWWVEIEKSGLEWATDEEIKEKAVTALFTIIDNLTFVSFQREYKLTFEEGESTLLIRIDIQ